MRLVKLFKIGKIILEQIKERENKDNFEDAVLGLSLFCLNYCKDVRNSKIKKDLVFRCSECSFSDGSLCLLKKQASEMGMKNDLITAMS